GDEEVALDAEAAPLGQVDPGLDRKAPPPLDRAAAGLMSVRRLVRPRADAVRDRVARLAGISGLRDSRADEPVELGELRARPEMVDRPPIDREQLVEQLVVARLERARADGLRVVAPVPVRTDPDLEQGP